MGGCFSSESENKKIPLQVKGCTDVFWLIVFILFALGMAVIAVSIETFVFFHIKLKRATTRVIKLIFCLPRVTYLYWI